MHIFLETLDMFLVA